MVFKDPVLLLGCTNLLYKSREHCKSRHLKLWCHRCKEFQADTQDEMNIHLRHDDCQMNEESPGSAYSRNDSNSQIRDELDLPRTCTWERVFKVLFHRNTPDPCKSISHVFIYIYADFDRDEDRLGANRSQRRSGL
jgi:hypothetical protein